VAAGLKKGDKVRVRYEMDGPAAPWLEATVTYLAPVADASTSDSQRVVHLQLPNPNNREAGLWVEALFPAPPATPSAAAAAATDGVERSNVAAGNAK
jgi:hypothetical protein